MKKTFINLLIVMVAISSTSAQKSKVIKSFERISIASRMPGLNISLLHLPSSTGNEKPPVLFIHGASFPSALAFGFRMDNYSWMDDLSMAGYDVFALDFLGYGDSDRYPEMLDSQYEGSPLGVGCEAALDIEKAIQYILQTTSYKKLCLIGHSWGATVAGYYASLHPEQIDKLVLFAPFVYRPGPADWEAPNAAYAELTPEERVAEFSNGIPTGSPNPLEDDVLANWGIKWLNSDPTSPERTSNTIRFPTGWKKDLYNCWNGDCFFDPSKIITPTLVIRGEWDTTLTDKDAKWLIGELKNTSLKQHVVIGKATHVMHLEKPRFQLYHAVRSFLNFQQPK